MNYILEIKAFQDEVQLKQLSTGQIALWYALMYINNKCNWTEWFTVANRMLESNSGLSRQGILTARNVLKQYGYIEFKSNGTKATSYKLNSMLKFVQSSIQDSVQDNIQVNIQNSSTLNKQNETKQNESIITPISPLQGKERREQNELVETNNNNKKKTITVFDTNSFEFLASKHLRDDVLKRIPRANVPRTDEGLQKWAMHIEYMKRIDKHTETEIRDLIEFATTDSFWRVNILSTKKLRAKKDVLYGHMNEKQKGGHYGKVNGNRKQNTDKSAEYEDSIARAVKRGCTFETSEYDF